MLKPETPRDEANHAEREEHKQDARGNQDVNDDAEREADQFDEPVENEEEKNFHAPKNLAVGSESVLTGCGVGAGVSPFTGPAFSVFGAVPGVPAAVGSSS